jgi:hypothetical protein
VHYEVVLHHFLPVVVHGLIHALNLRAEVQNVIVELGRKLRTVLMNLGGIHFAQYFLTGAHFRILLVQEGHVDIVLRVTIVN